MFPERRGAAEAPRGSSGRGVRGFLNGFWRETSNTLSWLTSNADLTFHPISQPITRFFSDLLGLIWLAGFLGLSFILPSRILILLQRLYSSYQEGGFYLLLSEVRTLIRQITRHNIASTANAIIGVLPESAVQALQQASYQHRMDLGSYFSLTFAVTFTSLSLSLISNPFSRFSIVLNIDGKALIDVLNGVYSATLLLVFEMNLWGFPVKLPVVNQTWEL